jgi:hypothetical protein
MRDVVTVVNVAVDAAVRGAQALRASAGLAGDPAALHAVAEVLDDVARPLAMVLAARPGVETLSRARAGIAAQAELLHDGLRYLLDQVAVGRDEDQRTRLMARNASYETLDMAAQLENLAFTLHQALQAAAVNRKLLVPTRTVQHGRVPYAWQPGPHRGHPHVLGLLEPAQAAHSAVQALALPVAVAHDALGIPAPGARGRRVAHAARLDLDAQAGRHSRRVSARSGPIRTAEQ